MKKHIACIPTSRQNGQDRFVRRGLAPRLSAWRCDLTALSQRYNLYFLASRTVVHVYEPEFPGQKLTADPVLTLHPPETGVRGFGIDPMEPHSINRILVEYLGNEEVLLVACDDGDVIGYRTSTILRALQRRDNRSEPAREDDAHIFLHRNVGASAWGLAVHREARIIAISANTRKITIIAYALAEHTDEADDSAGNTPESSKSTSHLPFCRQTENIFQLYTTNNLPSLSFYDSSGRWLLSSCIDGQTILWDLHLKHKAVTYQFGWCMSAKDFSITPLYGLNGFTCACPSASNVLHGAWGTIPLDARSAHYLSPAQEKMLKLEDVQGYFVNGNAQKKRFTAEAPNPPISNFVFEESENELSDVDDDETESLGDQIQVGQPSDFIQDIEAFAQQESQDVANAQQFLNNLLAAHRALEVSRPVAKPYCSIERSSHDPGGRGLEDPFMILTKEDIFLVQRPFGASKHIMSMQRPLHLGEWAPSLAPHDRHCFFSHIAELGVFIIGSPIGRAAVFSLYWTKDEGNPHRRYGFKLEYLLPFKADNENEITGVPAERLVGVAVSPIQGMFDTSEETARSVNTEQDVHQPRRWRVLMYYMNHTVLSFELSKPREEQSPDPQELVV